MEDKRAEKLAELVLDYSVSLKDGDTLLLQYDPNFSDYARMFSKIASKRNTEIIYDTKSHNPYHIRDLLLRYDKKEWENELIRRKKISQRCSARVLIDCSSLSDFTNGIEDSEKRLAEFDREVVYPYKKVLYRPGKNSPFEVRWNIVAFPNEELATDSGMSYDDFSDFLYSSTIGQDWNKINRDIQKVKRIFDNTKEVNIYVPGQTDIRFNLEGRSGAICDGKLNMPGGEVFYGPVEDSINGEIYFQLPTRREGAGILEGIKLKFKDGVVVDYSVDKGSLKDLESYLEIANETRMVGEFGIGCNYGISNPTLDVLFDEKIGGTIHFALGSSCSSDLSEGGGLIPKEFPHWDIVCDLRKYESKSNEFLGGEMRADGKLIQKDGRWLF